MISHNGENYELKYNLKRIEMIEGVTNMPTLADIRRTGGMLSVATLKTYIAYGIKKEGADAFLAPKKGMEVAEALIESNGYANVCGLVMETLERDCPFFFRAD